MVLWLLKLEGLGVYTVLLGFRSYAAFRLEGLGVLLLLGFRV